MIKKAKWIWSNNDEMVNQYVDFFREFELEKLDNDAFIEIAVDTNYALWINDNFVDCGQYFDVETYKSYDTINISKFLKIGTNKLHVQAYYAGESNFTYKKGKAGLCFAMVCQNVIILSDETVLCRKASGFEQGENVHKTTFQLGYGFNFDANEEDEEYKNAVEVQNQFVLVERPIKKLCLTKKNAVRIIQQGFCLRRNNNGKTAENMYSDYLSYMPFNKIFEGSKSFPANFVGEKRTNEGVYIVVDLGEESSGYLTFDIDTNCGCNVEIAYGEHLVDGRVRSAINGLTLFANKYVAREGRKSFTYYMKRMAMRYIQIHFYNFSELNLHDVSIISADYPLPEAKKLDINDELHKKIYEISARTLRLCMHEHYEDCPWREQALYGSDSRNAALCTYHAFGEYKYARASLDLFLSEVMNNGYFRICAPSDVNSFIPSFSMIALSALSEYTEYSNDVTLAEKHWDNIKNMLFNAVNSKDNGFICPPKENNTWVFYEWADDWFEFEKKTEGKTVLDGLHMLFLCLAIESTVSVAEKLNDTRFINEYQIKLRELKEMFDEMFWDNGKKLYSSFRVEGELVRFDELTQSLAVLLGIAKGERRDFVLDALASDNDLVEITLGYAIYKYEALLVEREKYQGFVLEDIAQKWGKMLFEGSTSFWETKDGEAAFDDAGSLCHAWSATPIIVYSKLFGDKGE